MRPAQPPLPTAWNLPFHPDAGSHTSILMSESFDGVRVAATRQNAGKREKRAPAGAPAASIPPAPGGVKAPGATLCANVIFAFGSEREAKLSHEAAIAGEPLQANIAVSAANNARPAELPNVFLASTASPPRKQFHRHGFRTNQTPDQIERHLSFRRRSDFRSGLNSFRIAPSRRANMKCLPQCGQLGTQSLLCGSPLRCNLRTVALSSRIDETDSIAKVFRKPNSSFDVRPDESGVGPVRPLRDRIFGELLGLRIEPGDIVPAHVRKPDVPIHLIVVDSIDRRVRRGRLVKLYGPRLHIQFPKSMPQEISEPKIVRRINRNPPNAHRSFGMDVLGFARGGIQFDQRPQRNFTEPNHPLIVHRNVVRPALSRM